MTSNVTKTVGVKRMVMISSSVIDNIHEHEVSKSIARGSIEDFAKVISAFYSSGGSIYIRDAKTGETFFHVFCKHLHLYLNAKSSIMCYMLGTKIDLDLQDYMGDTALHKVCLFPGAWRCIVAIMRCNASPLIRNNAGLTPEEQILRYKNPGWEENLYWLRKFSPGLWTAVTNENPDTALIERLLKSWCRTLKVIDGHSAVSLKTQLNSDDHQLDLVLIVEKYENTNEMALAMLSGKTYFIDMWEEAELLNQVDVNTKDHSYQFHFQDYPTAPRPLLAALWETEQFELLKKFMKFKPNTSVKYTFDAESESPPKPLFFQLLNPRSRPQNEAIIATIFESADLNIRDENGQTVLFEAIQREETESIIKIILRCGVNIAARDKNGRTAMDHCILRQRNDYKKLLDDYVLDLVNNCDTEGLEQLVLELYVHSVPERFNTHCGVCLPCADIRELSLPLLNVKSTQGMIKSLFSLVKAGNLTHFCEVMTPKFSYARDKAGRSFLHYAVQSSKYMPIEKKKFSSSDVISKCDLASSKKAVCIYSKNERSEVIMDKHRGSDCELYRKVLCGKVDKPGVFSIIKFLVDRFPHIVDLKNNLGQTALHYAHIFAVNIEIIDFLEEAGCDSQSEDVFGLMATDYCLPKCGLETFIVRRKHTIEIDLNIFLTESHFEEHLQTAVQTGQLSEIIDLIDPLIEYGGECLFSHALFDCLDANQIDTACFLIRKGFNVVVTKQYETCNPENPMCAMMECTHAVTTLRQRAVERGATELINLIDKKVEWEKRQQETDRDKS